MTAIILKLNAYGYRWHVMADGGHGIVYSAKTLWACRDYCRRRKITVREGPEH